MQCVHIPEHTKPLIMLNGYWGSQQYEQQDHLWGRHFPPCINIPIINKNPTGIWSVSVSQAGVNQQHKCGLWGVLQANLHINCSALQEAEREVGFRVVAGERLICREKEKRFNKVFKNTLPTGSTLWSGAWTEHMLKKNYLRQFSVAQWQRLVLAVREEEEAVHPSHETSLHLENLLRNYIPP